MTPSTYTCPVSLGDKVYKIQNMQKQVWHQCELCEGAGVIHIKGKERTCPDCHGNKGTNEWVPSEWRIVKNILSEYGEPPVDCGYCVFTIGQIQLEHTRRTPRAKEIDMEWRVMCYETGVGSGTVHNIADMFATVEEAEAECIVRNTLKIEEN